MLNQCILVGRVVNIKEEKKTTIITLRIARNYKNPDTNEYEENSVDVQLSYHLSKTALEFLSENATLGYKKTRQIYRKDCIIKYAGFYELELQ